jgi:hypothetical protein
MKRCEVRARARVKGKQWGVFTAVGAKFLMDVRKDDEGLYYYRLRSMRRESRPFKTLKRAIEMGLTKS